MNIENTIYNSITDEALIWADGEEYYFETGAAYHLFLEINSKDYDATPEEIYEKYYKVCQIQEHYFNIHGSWDGFGTEINTKIIAYLVSEWNTAINEEPKDILGKVL